VVQDAKALIFFFIFAIEHYRGPSAYTVARKGLFVTRKLTGCSLLKMALELLEREMKKEK
jgi:hypothetical protein